MGTILDHLAQIPSLPAPKPHVLIFGAGLVSQPMFDYFAKYGYFQTIAALVLPPQLSKIPNSKTVQINMDAPDADHIAEELVKEADLVVSLLPYLYHAKVAVLAAKHGKHFCTTSYVQKGIPELGPQFESANKICLNECGVDPGLDHMSAKTIIDEAHKRGAKVMRFVSLCGGLPAVKDNNNPMGYKFSWAPRGVLLASRNGAKYLDQGKVIEIAPAGGLFAPENVGQIEVEGLGKFEWYFNRDSTSYTGLYNLEEAETVIRGTIRNIGWCRALKAFSGLGLLSTDPAKLDGKTYLDLMRELAGASAEENVKKVVAAKLKVAEDDDIIARLEWLGLFEATKISNAPTILDALCTLCIDKMKFAPNEKDLLLMRHEFTFKESNGSITRLQSSLISEGEQPNGPSAMASLVSLPLAIACRGILEGRFTHLKGLVHPVNPDVRDFVLKQIGIEYGFRFVEKPF